MQEWYGGVGAWCGDKLAATNVEMLGIAVVQWADEKTRNEIGLLVRGRMAPSCLYYGRES
jgi:hypothetical protein